ncbi:MAG TPA: hypothetical protein VMI06_14525 [Terriglobia bacterium]|nr:hypothetical protein [Terriglobia bacterium]
MRCSEIRENLEPENDGHSKPFVREHLAVCSHCRSYAADLSKLAAGMKLLAEDRVPEPSIGFHTRVLRRLEQESGRDFLERAGRRVVYATLIVVLFLLLAMIVPSSGPVRRSPSLETYWPQQETVAEGNYQIPMESLSAEPVLVDVKSSGPDGR